jgi:hypothetical protein
MRFALPRSLFLSVALLLAASLSAQASLSVGVPMLQHDTSATISLTDPTHANQEVTVTITNADPTKPEVQKVTIKLNELGVGETKWWVPCWDFAAITAEGITLTMVIR